MAFSKSIHRAQIPVGCQLCESGTTIQWKCMDCSLLLCSKCKEFHLKIRNASIHKIVHIKEVRLLDESEENMNFCDINCQEHDNQTCVFYCKTCEQFICIKCITKGHKGHDAVDEEEYKAELNKLLEMQRETESKLSKLALSKVIPSKTSFLKFASEKKKLKEEQTKPNIKVTRQFTTGLKNIFIMESCSHDSLWIADWTSSVMQHVQLSKDNMQTLSELNLRVFGMAVSATNNLLLSIGGDRLKLRNERTGHLSDSKYKIAPLKTYSLHVTRDQKIIIGVLSTPKLFTGTGRQAVIVMDEEGNHLNQFEHDNNNKPLFTAPYGITCTKNGIIFVLDLLDKSYRGRVVVLGQEGNIIQIYNGHPDVNSLEKPFHTTGILTTPADNVIVADCYNHTLHLLSCNGEALTYISTAGAGIVGPYSLALCRQGHLLIGCAALIGISDKAKLYEVQYSGF